MKKLELLAPAGSYDGLIAAVNAGADAVYIGGEKYSARAFAENPEEERLLAALDYAHLRDKKVYLTLNTLLKDKELKDLYHYLKNLYEAGLDGIIFQDFGVMKFVREQFPDLPLHASTQLSITDASGCNWLEKQGCSRVVLARELSLSEIRKIHEECAIELEVFIHGALCYSYSGQCLLSSMLGGRSGNRGRCAQPCRLPYQLQGGKAEYLLSPKDLCGIDFIPQLAEAGAASLKIEGRMKRPEYAAGVTEVYRRAIDSYYDGAFAVSKEDREQLLNLYSRSGNCSGYLNRHNGAAMMTFSSPGYRMGEESLFKRIHKDYLEQDDRLPMEGTCKFALGKPSVLTVSCKGTSVQAEGDCPETAKKQPLNREQTVERLSKTGDTGFVFESIDIALEDNLFLPVQSLNTLRRTALQLLKDALLRKYRHSRPKELPDILIPQKHGNNTGKPSDFSRKAPIFSVFLSTLEQAEAVSRFPEIEEVTLDSQCCFFDFSAYHKIVKRLSKAHKQVYLAFPYIFRQKSRQLFELHYEDIFMPELSGFLVRNLESVQFIKERLPNDAEFCLRSDSGLYTFNSLSQKVLMGDGFSRITLPVELNKKELEALSASQTELIVYSRLPLMITAGCIKAHKEACKKESGSIILTDRYKKQFPVQNNCIFCYNILYNSAPLVLWDKEKELYAIGPQALRLDFHLESGREAGRIINAFLKKDAPQGDFTRGHFNRGVSLSR